VGVHARLSGVDAGLSVVFAETTPRRRCPRHRRRVRACLVFFHLLREKLTADTALWAVALLAASPLAALFQMGYAESLFLLWLFLALWLLVRRRFVWLYPLIVVMGYTRPGVLAFALLLGAYGVVRWRAARDPLPTVQVVHIVALGVLAVAVGFSWQVIAGAVTGDPAAYMETELSWRRGWIGEGGFVPFDGFVQGAALWFRLWGSPRSRIRRPRGGRRWRRGRDRVRAARAAARPEMRLWSASYVLYLLVVFFPQSSIFRLLLPLAPLYGAIAAPRHALWRWGCSWSGSSASGGGSTRCWRSGTRTPRSPDRDPPARRVRPVSRHTDKLDR
jgi:hypothetical protein